MLHHIIICRPELILTNIRYINGIIIHLAAQCLNKTAWIHKIRIKMTSVHISCFLLCQFFIPCCVISRNLILKQILKDHMHIAYQRNRCSEILADLSRIHIDMDNSCIPSLKLVRLHNGSVCYSGPHKYKDIALMNCIVSMRLTIGSQHAHI